MILISFLEFMAKLVIALAFLRLLQAKLAHSNVGQAFSFLLH